MTSWDIDALQLSQQNPYTVDYCEHIDIYRIYRKTKSGNNEDIF